MTDAEQHVVALRDEIRRVGQRAQRRWRWIARLALFARGPGLVITLLAFALAMEGGDLFAPLAAAAGIAVLAMLPLLGGLIIADVAIAMRLRKALRGRLQSLTGTRRAEVLLPLFTDPEEEARRLAALLAHDLRRRPAEVSPGDAPEGRGDELIPRP